MFKASTLLNSFRCFQIFITFHSVWRLILRKRIINCSYKKPFEQTKLNQSNSWRSILTIFQSFLTYLFLNNKGKHNIVTTKDHTYPLAAQVCKWSHYENKYKYNFNGTTLWSIKMLTIYTQLTSFACSKKFQAVGLVLLKNKFISQNHGNGALLRITSNRQKQAE